MEPLTFSCVFVTGGAGFIGSHAARRLVLRYPQTKVIVLDALTYAGNLNNLNDVSSKSNFYFERVDIRDAAALRQLFEKHKPDAVMHLAAESHVDRSIHEPLAFVTTNVVGTANLLNEARLLWENDISGKRFLHVSTDEVYGSLGDTGLFTEQTAYDPRSPYSASKAGSDHLVSAYFHTYGLPALITNCSNNYGAFQFPEKLIPLFITNILEGKELPVYGSGSNVRDWLFVEDHAEALDLVLHSGAVGETYNIGGQNEWDNLSLVKKLCELMDEATGKNPGSAFSLVRYVTDRSGHDFRYAIDCSKIGRELGWTPTTTFEQGLQLTIKWYLENTEWVANVKSGEYRQFYERHYSNR